MLSAESHDFTNPCGLTHKYTHTERLAENNCSGSCPAWFHAASLTRVRRSEQGSACRGKRCRVVGLWRRPVAGKALPKGEVLCWKFWISTERLSRHHGGRQSSFPLSSSYHNTTERQCQRNMYQEYFQERTALTTAIQSLKTKMFETLYIKLKL